MRRSTKVDCVQVVVEGALLRLEREALIGEPFAAAAAPGGARQRAAVAEAEFREAVPVAHPVQPGILTRANKIAGALQLGARYPDWFEQPAREQTRELARVASIRLDPLARQVRHQPRCHDPAINPALDQVAIQAEPGRAGLVAAQHLRPTSKRPLDGDGVIGQGALVEQLVCS